MPLFTHWLSFSPTLLLMVTFLLTGKLSKKAKEAMNSGCAAKLAVKIWLAFSMWWTNQWPVHFCNASNRLLARWMWGNTSRKHMQMSNWYWCDWVLKLIYATLAKRLKEKAACNCLGWDSDVLVFHHGTWPASNVLSRGARSLTAARRATASNKVLLFKHSPVLAMQQGNTLIHFWASISRSATIKCL